MYEITKQDNGMWLITTEVAKGTVSWFCSSRQEAEASAKQHAGDNGVAEPKITYKEAG